LPGSKKGPGIFLGDMMIKWLVAISILFLPTIAFAQISSSSTEFDVSLTPVVQNAIAVSSATNKVTVTGLTLADNTIAGVQGAITGQNILGPSATALNGGVPVTRTSYPLPAPPAGANNVGWWCYTTGTVQTTGSPLSVQSCLSVMAYWNGTAFSYGGNMFNVLNAGGTGVTPPITFAQLFLSGDRTTVVFYFDIGVAGSLADMYWAATQITGAQPGL
jgi:hypothetical protein